MRGHPGAYIERQTAKVAALGANPDFAALCVFAKVPCSHRQARKYARRSGRAYAMRAAWENEKAAKARAEAEDLR